MKVVKTFQGMVVTVEEVYMGPPRNAIEKVDRMFDIHFAFGELKNPTVEVIALLREAAQEMAQIHHELHQQAEDAIAAFRNRVFIVRWFAKTPAACADHTEEEVLAAYRGKFEKFLHWLEEKNRTSRFYQGHLNDEITACAAVLRALYENQPYR